MQKRRTYPVPIIPGGEKAYREIGRLAETVHFDPILESKFKQIFEGEEDLDDYDCVQDLIRSCLHHPTEHHKRMTALNHLLDCCGIESFHAEHRPSQPVLGEFINTGEDYCPTVCYHVAEQEYLIMSQEEFRKLLYGSE